MDNNVGAVTADIKLNTKQFEEAVKKLKDDVSDIKKSFNKQTSGKGLTEEVKNLKKEIESLREKTDSYRETIKTLREQNADYAKGIENLNKLLEQSKKEHSNFTKELKNEQTTLDNVTKSAGKYVKLQDRMTKFSASAVKSNLSKKGMGSLFSLGTGRGKYGDFSQWIKSLNTGSAKLKLVDNAFLKSEITAQTTLEGMKMAYLQYDRVARESAQKEKVYWQTRQSNMRNAMESMVAMTRNLIIEQRKAFGSEGGYNNYINTMSKVRGEFEKVNNVNFTKLSENLYKNGQLILNWGKSWKTTQNEVYESTRLLSMGIKEVDGELVPYVKNVYLATEVLNTFNFKLLETVNTTTKSYKTTMELASAMHRLSTQGTANWGGRQTTGGYSNYVSQSGQITESLKKQAQAAKETKLATEGLSQAYRKTNLNTYKANLNQINKTLEQQRLRTAQLEAAQQSLYYKNAPNNLNTYKMNMDKINQSLEKQTGNHKKINQEVKTGQMSMREFGTRMGQAEAYSNNLYRGLQKVRSVIVSMRTIMGAMGGMAIWNFAFELVDKAKETYSAKNEMESLLNKNSHVNAEGVQVFNKELDNTIKKFQRLNKYSLGETAASIGLEFDLNAKEMADSFNVIAMVQNEYIRAGRTAEEASLAVKDILQGEFQRLSRETGIGKEELGEFGYKGNPEDVKNLMDALEKAGLSRHWDLFAEKASSLDDVITITQNRFGEFGADLITNIEPMIVGAFNGINGVVDSLKNGFSSMGSFGQYFTIGGGAIGAFTGIATTLMILKRNMGLAQIATMGWGKSFFTALLGLNKTDVAMHGFLKTLTATISGTKASEVANVGLGKSLAARLLGVKANIAGEEGFLKAIMVSQGALRGESEIMTLTSASGLTLSQKLAAVTRNMSATEVKGKSMAWSFGKIITSAKVLRLALIGITSVALIAYFASVAQWADTVKKRIDTYKDVLANGKEKLEENNKVVDAYTQRLDKQKGELSNLTKGTAEYNEKLKQVNQTTQNLNTAKWNSNDLELSLKLAKQIKKEDKEISKQHDLTNEGILDRIYSENGVKNIEQYGKNYQQIKLAAYDIKHSEEERNKFQYASLQHINEHVQQMEKAGIAEKDRVKYITEYSSKAEEAADHLKKFNQGDINEGMYYVLARFQLMWIDLWNDKHFIQFWDSVQKTWKEILPTLKQLWNYLIDVGHSLLDFFSTDIGRYTGLILGFGTAFGVVGLKVAKWVSGSKSVFEVLKKVGGKLKDVAKGWKKVADNAEEASTKTGGATTTTGGINGDVSTPTKTPFKETLKNDAKNYARAAIGIAAGMALITEAIILLKAPMWGLAEVGKQFKAQEPEIRAGIDGLKLISPVLAILLPAVVGLSLIMDKYAPSFSQIIKGTLKAALGIAAGMLLVAETIFMIIPSIWALGSLGDQYSGIQTQVQKGTEAMKVVSDSLMYLAPFIPALALGVTTVALAFANPLVGAIMGTALTLGIPIGMLWVAETIWSLQYPLQQIGALGEKYPDLSGIKQGAETIKVTAEAMGYVEDAMRSFAGIVWSEISTAIADIVANFVGIDLSQLTGEDGFFSKLETFTSEFNKVEITPIDQAKVTTLSDSATGISSVKTALTTVKDALKDLPDFNVDNRSTTQKYQDNVAGTTGADTTGVTNYFEQLKTPIDQLNEFINHFNNDIEVVEIDQAKVSTLQNSATGISAINTAIEAVKTALGTSVDAAWNGNMASGGILGAVAGFVMGDGNPNASGLKSGLDELYLSVKDIMDFNTRIAGLTGGSEGGDTANIQGASNMVSALQTEINNLQTTLSGAVPTVKSTAKGMGTAIVTGVSEGLSTLTSTVSTSLDGATSTFKTKGESWGTNLTNGFKDKFKIQDAAKTEVDNTLANLGDDKKQEFYDKGKAMGEAFSTGFKDGAGIHSPGYAAQAMQSEVGYIGQYITDGIANLPNLAIQLASSVSNNFNPSLSLGNFELPDLSSFQQGLTNVISMAGNAKTQVSTKFNEMRTNIGTSFTNIKTNVGTSFGNIVSNTRTSLANMMSATVKNIGNIRTSWKGMQDALIASAENIKTQTGQKISKLKTNLGDFWNKVKHPDQLISGSAGGHKGSIRRRFGGSANGHYAGGSISRSQSLFRTVRSSGQPSDNSVLEYLKCMLETGKPCYAGGWNFNWSPSISRKFKGWNTHFGAYHLDDFLNVGKFENNNFPVKGRADVAKAYIFDVISSTDYDKYFDSNFGDDPVAALRAGAFNCWDGTNIVLAIARAFGFDGSRGHGTWNGIGHVWASIPGLGIIDPTAIQQNGSFKSSAVKGYAGSMSRRYASRNDSLPNNGDTYNTNIEINVHGDDVEVNNKRISKESGRQILDILGINPATGN